MRILGNPTCQHFPIHYNVGILTANITYCIILFEYVNESQVNACVVWELLGTCRNVFCVANGMQECPIFRGSKECVEHSSF